MATRKTKKKIETSSFGLKILGTIINLGGLIGYSIFNPIFAISAVGVVSEKSTKELGDILAIVSKACIFETVILLGDVGLFELLNYIVYLNKKKEYLLGLLVIEAVAVVVGGLNLGFDYPLLYVTLLPIITGLINYAILVKEGK